MKGKLIKGHFFLLGLVLLNFVIALITGYSLSQNSLFLSKTAIYIAGIILFFKVLTLKNTFPLLTLILLLSACLTKTPKKAFNQDHLTYGTYYYRGGRSFSDTVRFNTRKIIRGDWNYTIWKVTKDSIFQEDSHGLSYSLGTDKRKYKLNQDTLYIWTNIKIDKGRIIEYKKTTIEKYLVISSDSTKLELININKRETLNQLGGRDFEPIRRDIQLR